MTKQHPCVSARASIQGALPLDTLSFCEHCSGAQQANTIGKDWQYHGKRQFSPVFEEQEQPPLQ